MGLHGLMSAVGMNVFGLSALVLSFGTFVALLIWIARLPGREIEACARLPLEGDE